MGWFEDLSVQIRFCRRCSLWQNCRGPIPAHPETLQPGIVVIGQNPGVEEDRRGIPFVGASGQFLDTTLLPALGFSRDQAYITNVIRCYAKSGDITKEAMRLCRPFLQMEMAHLNPRVILILGTMAWESISGERIPFGEVVNRVLPGAKRKAVYVVMRHPSYYLRNEEKQRRFVKYVLPKLGNTILARFSVLLHGGSVESQDHVVT